MERLAKNPPHTWFDEHLFDDFKGGSPEDYVERLQPEVIAQHRMINWLAHPMEFGTEPSSIALWDHRIIHWPPTDDEREMFLFKYEYAPTEKEDVRCGVGLVVYWQDDPRGKKRTIKKGKQLLGF